MLTESSRADNIAIRGTEWSSAVGRRGWLTKVARAAAGGAAALLGGGGAAAAQSSTRLVPSTATGNANASELDILLSKQAITEVIYRYSRGLDRMDKELCNSIWNPGATFEFPQYKGTGPGFIDWVWEIHKTRVAHSHQMTNILIKVTGDTAVSETYGLISLYGQSGNGKTVLSLHRDRYIDRWSRHNGVWGIDHRRVVVDFGGVQEATGPLFATDSRRDTMDPSYAIFGR